MVFIQQKDVGKLSSTFETLMMDDLKGNKKKMLRNPYFEVQKVKAAYKGLHKKLYRIVFDRNGLKSVVSTDSLQLIYKTPISKVASAGEEDKILLDWFYLEKYMIPIFKLSIKNDKILPDWVFEEITIQDMKQYCDTLNESLGNFVQKKRNNNVKMMSPRIQPGEQAPILDEDNLSSPSSLLFSKNIKRMDSAKFKASQLPKNESPTSKGTGLKKLNLRIDSDSDFETVPGSFSRFFNF
jgi:hypothetical protein